MVFTIFSPIESKYRHLWFFLLWAMKIFQHPQYRCFTQATSIKLRNSFIGQHLVDLVKTYSFTSLSRTSTPLLVALYCMMISGVLSFFSLCTCHHDGCDERRVTVLFLAGTYEPVLVHW